MAQGHVADVEAQLHALLHALVDDAAHEGDEDALRLVALDQLHALLGGGSRADDDCHAGDVPGDQGHAQLTDLGVGEVAHDGVLIGGAVGHGVLHELNDLRGEGGGHAGGENILGAAVAGHESLDLVFQGGLGLAYGAHLLAGHGVEAGEGVGGVAKDGGGVGAQLCHGLVHRLDRQSIHLVVSGENALE